jgi:hypothetical protein
MLVACFSAGSLAADDRSELSDALEPLVAAMSSGDIDLVIALLPRNQELRNNVTSLLTQAEVSSSIQPVEVHKQVAKVDWFLEVKLRATGSLVDRRQALVTVRREGKKILALEPVAFFRPHPVA